MVIANLVIEYIGYECFQRAVQQENPHLKAIVVCKAADIINGVDSEGTFTGRDNMTRAQAAVVMVKLDEYLNGTGSSTTNPGSTNPGTTDPKPETSSNPTGGKDSNGYTLASDVKSSVGKSDSYPTKVWETTANRNGYYTATDVGIGDAMEEYTLLRAKELTSKYSHERPNDQYSHMSEAAAKGYNNVQATFIPWMNSPGHRASIMEKEIISMCATRCGSYWIITFGGSGAPSLVEGGAPVNYEKYNGRIEP